MNDSEPEVITKSPCPKCTYPRAHKVENTAWLHCNGCGTEYNTAGNIRDKFTGAVKMDAASMAMLEGTDRALYADLQKMIREIRREERKGLIISDFIFKWWMPFRIRPELELDKNGDIAVSNVCATTINRSAIL